MEYLLYLLAAFVALFFFDILVGFVIPIITIPVTWAIVRLTVALINRPTYLGYRFDMIFQGIARGGACVYFADFIYRYLFNQSSFWFVAISIGILSIGKFRSWNAGKSWNYEFSLVGSVIVGYLLGFLVFLLVVF